MYTKTFTYTDFKGNKRTETARFNLTKAELVEMQNSHLGGLDARVERISEQQDNRAIMEIFKDIIRRSYGVISDDGRRFEKSDELFEDFSQTEMYSMLFMELLSGYEAATEFINGIIPDDVTTALNRAAAQPPSESASAPVLMPTN